MPIFCCIFFHYLFVFISGFHPRHHHVKVYLKTITEGSGILGVVSSLPISSLLSFIVASQKFPFLLSRYSRTSLSGFFLSDFSEKL